MKKAKIFNSTFKILFLLFLFIVLYSFITTPYTGDIKVFMAAANQVKYQPHSGIVGIFEAWELKGIANRILMYFIYSITNKFVVYGDIVSFQIVSKIVYALLTILLLSISTILLPSAKREKVAFFLIGFLAIFATFTAVQMQAEMSCIILCILIFACILHRTKYSLSAAGVLGSTLFFF